MDDFQVPVQITPDSAWPNIHMVEVVRSCPELCRFCLASYLTLPFRSPSIETGLIPAIEKGLNATKRIGLLGASVTQHPQFSELLNWLSQDGFEDMRLSLSSVRATTVNKKMTSILARRNCKSITIAIESGIQNATVGITIGNIIMPLGTGISILSLPSGVYGILMYLICLPVVFLFFRKNK